MAEATKSRRPRTLGASGNGASGAAATLGSSLAAPVRAGLQGAGDLGAFTGRTLAELRGVWRYSAEILRQAGILITGSAAVIWFMEFVMGMECGLEANYVLRGYGALTYAGVFTAYCNTRECIPYMFGYIVSAKVGCGLVAEIGSMRINEELDAMDTMGLNPMRYVIATRIVAGMLVFPIIIIVGAGFQYLASYLILIVSVGGVSQGGWETIHWGFIPVADIGWMVFKCMLLAFSIMMVGMYYGYRASGGPVGVGTATARSMILNLVLVHFLNTITTLFIWGIAPKAPVGG